LFLLSNIPAGRIRRDRLISRLSSGDEIFSVNGRAVAGLTHSEAIGMFKETKVGAVQVTLGRREAKRPEPKE
jgi:C-terminal processing protease CtpA/Prc